MPEDNTMNKALEKAGRKYVEFTIIENGQKITKRARREDVAAQAIWNKAMQGDTVAFKLIYDVLNGPPEQRFKIVPGAASKPPLEMNPDRRLLEYNRIAREAAESERTMINITPGKESREDDATP